MVIYHLPLNQDYRRVRSKRDKRHNEWVIASQARSYRDTPSWTISWIARNRTAWSNRRSSWCSCNCGGSFTNNTIRRRCGWRCRWGWRCKHQLLWNSIRWSYKGSQLWRSCKDKKFFPLKWVLILIRKMCQCTNQDIEVVETWIAWSR